LPEDRLVAADARFGAYPLERAQIIVNAARIARGQAR
jgi:hypothetical protein